MHVRRRSWIFGLSSSLILAAVPAALADGTPHIVLSQPAWDFGTVHPTDKVEFELSIGNVGDADLRLDRVFGCCGCRVSPLEKYVLPPGEHVKAQISFDIRVKSGPTQARVTIKSNDPERPELLFQVSGIVKRSVKLTPAHGLRFNMLDPNATQTQSIRLLNQENEPLRPELNPLKTDKFTAELRPVQAGRAYDLIVTTRPPFSRTPSRETIRITTGLAAEPQIDVLVQAQVVDRVELYPTVMYVPASSEALRRVVVVRYFGKDPQFAVTRAECAAPGLKLQVNTPDTPPARPQVTVLLPTRSVRIDVFLAAGASLPAEGARLKVFTNDPEYPEVSLVLTSDRKVYEESRRHAETHSQRRPVP